MEGNAQMTLIEVIEHLKSPHAYTYDMSQYVKPHMRTVVTQLFLRINWMKTWFRTNHPTQMYKDDSPFRQTIELFKEVTEEDFPIVFLIWCLELVTKCPIDWAYDVGGTIAKTTEDYDKQNCFLNIVSDILFLPAAKNVLLDTSYHKNFEEILNAKLIRIKKAEFTIITNPMLTEEICNHLSLRAAEL